MVHSNMVIGLHYGDFSLVAPTIIFCRPPSQNGEKSQADATHLADRQLTNKRII